MFTVHTGCFGVTDGANTRQFEVHMNDMQYVGLTGYPLRALSTCFFDCP